VKSGFGASRRRGKRKGARRATGVSPGPQPLTLSPEPLNPKPKIGLFYFGKKRTFLNWLDKSKEFS